MDIRRWVQAQRERAAMTLEVAENTVADGIADRGIVYKTINNIVNDSFVA